MTGFQNRLKVELVNPFANDGAGEWNLTAPLVYKSSLVRKLIEVPTGFSTDFASVPRLPMMYALFGGRYATPAVLHDYICRQRLYARPKCDLIFLEAMNAQNEAEIQAMKDAGIDDDEIAEQHSRLEGQARAMYTGVAFYTRTGFWKADIDKPGFEVVG